MTRVVLIAVAIVAVPFAIVAGFKWWKMLKAMPVRDSRAIAHFTAAAVAVSLTAAAILAIPAAMALDWPQSSCTLRFAIRWDDRAAYGYSLTIRPGDPARIVVGYDVDLLKREEGISFATPPGLIQIGHFQTLWLIVPLVYLSYKMVRSARENRRVILRKAFPIGDANRIGYPIHPAMVSDKARRHLPTAQVHA